MVVGRKRVRIKWGAFHMSKFRVAGSPRVLVACVLVASSFAIAAQASASDNEAPVSESSISSWSPAGIAPYDCSTVTWTGLEDFDLYHWIVSPDSYTVGSGPSQKKGQYIANFDKNGQKGSVVVTYDDGESEKLTYQTFGYGSIQSNHLYTAVPAGKKVVSAKLNYLIDVKSTKGDPVPPTSDKLTSSHVLSHTCATPYSDPVIDVLTVNSSYEESYTESYSWDLTKSFNVSEGETADSKWFVKGEAPEFLITGTRTGPTIDDKSYVLVDGSVEVSGTFILENAVLADASISVTGDQNSGLGTADCDTSSTDVSGVFAYVCKLDPTTTDDAVPGNILKNLGFTVSGSVVGGNTEDVTNSFGDATNQNLSDTLGGTADVDDDLASLGGSGCTNCTIEDQGTDDPADDVLVLNGAADSFSLTYTSNWDWEKAETEEDCSQEFTNTASLTWSSGSKTTPFTWKVACPVPTVELNDDVASSYDLSYENNFSWSIAKKMIEVDTKTLNAKYEVTATRSGPVVENVAGTDVVVSGTFETTFASNSNVVVTLTFKDRDGADSTVNCDESEAAYTCTIDSDDLPELDSSKKESGWDEFEYFVHADVNTAGGSDETTQAEELGTPEDVTETDSNKSATVTDDLDGYAATSIECDADGEDCWSGATDVAAGSTLQTLSAEGTIVLKYELKWIGLVELSAESCPTIENVAVVTSGSEQLDDATSTEPMTCPDLVITLSTNDPQYVQTWDTKYDWTLAKKYLGADANTWQPKYSVTATRSTGIESNLTIVDESQKVTGTFLLELDPATSIIADPAKVSAAIGLDTDETDCVISNSDVDGEFTFECTVENESTITSKDGIRDVSYQLDWSGVAYGKKVTDSSPSKFWGMSTDTMPGDDVNKVATIVDTNGANLEPISITGGSKTGPYEVSSSDISTSSYTMTYTLNWQWNNGAGCGMAVTNTAQLKSDGAVLSTQSLSNTVTCPKSEPGLTIGYYGNKAGGTEVAKKYKESWQTEKAGSVNGWNVRWDNTLKSLPNFSTDAAVRDYMTLANCNSSKPNDLGKTCQTMFRAQALASTMNAIKNAKFGEQSVLFRGVCTKVSTLLRDALHSTSVDSSTTSAGIQTRIAYKTIFDDLNNSRALRCPSGS